MSVEELFPPPPEMTAEFAERHRLWVECLDGDSDNSILRQVRDLIWDDAVFRVINEGRRLANARSGQKRSMNVTVHRLIDRGFFHTQALGVRRQLDTYGLEGKKGVFSLRSLITDMDRHRELFTRRNLFAAAGIPIDLDAAEREEQAGIDHWHETRSQERWVPTMRSPFMVGRHHDAIDALTGATAATRRDTDIVEKRVFEELLRRLTTVEHFMRVVDKFVAHSATPESCADLSPEQLHVTLQDLWNAHEIMCHCIEYIDCQLLRQRSHSFLADAAYDVIGDFKLPLVHPEDLSALREYWREHKKRVGAWGDDPEKWLRSPHESTILSGSVPATES